MANEPGTDPQEPNTDPASVTGGNGSDESSIRESAVNDLLKTLGIDSTDSLKDIVTAKNEADKASQSDLQNAQADLDKMNQSNSDLTNEVTSLKATNAVLKAGVTSEHVDDATILAQARVSNGQAKDIDKAIKDVLKSNPQFTGDVATNKDGTAIVNKNVGGHDDNKKAGLGDMIAKLNAGRIIK